MLFYATFCILLEIYRLASFQEIPTCDKQFFYLLKEFESRPFLVSRTLFSLTSFKENFYSDILSSERFPSLLAFC